MLSVYHETRSRCKALMEGVVASCRRTAAGSEEGQATQPRGSGSKIAGGGQGRRVHGLGNDPGLIADKVRDASALVKKDGRQAWLTPYNFGDTPLSGDREEPLSPDNDMFTWLLKWLPTNSLSEIDYVGVSDYPVDWG